MFLPQHWWLKLMRLAPPPPLTPFHPPSPVAPRYSCRPSMSLPPRSPRGVMWWMRTIAAGLRLLPPLSLRISQKDWNIRRIENCWNWKKNKNPKYFSSCFLGNFFNLIDVFLLIIILLKSVNVSSLLSRNLNPLRNSLSHIDLTWHATHTPIGTRHLSRRPLLRFSCCWFSAACPATADATVAMVIKTNATFQPPHRRTNTNTDPRVSPRTAPRRAV